MPAGITRQLLIYNEEENLLFLTCGFPEKHILAIRPDGHGDVTATHVAWRETVGASYVPSPVAIGDYFMLVADNGVATCYVARTGERLYRERLEGSHSASLIAANGLAWFLSDAGLMSVVKPGPALEVISTSKVGQECYASPAVYGDQLIIRGEKDLFCIQGAADAASR